jgi:hypothetical protein
MNKTSPHYPHITNFSRYNAPALGAGGVAICPGVFEFNSFSSIERDLIEYFSEWFNRDRTRNSYLYY